MPPPLQVDNIYFIYLKI